MLSSTVRQCGSRAPLSTGLKCGADGQISWPRSPAKHGETHEPVTWLDIGGLLHCQLCSLHPVKIETSATRSQSLPVDSVIEILNKLSKYYILDVDQA